MNCKKTVIEEYLLNEMVESPREATIVFVDGKFSECNYGGTQSQYDYDDWMFLKAVAEKIKGIKYPVTEVKRERKK